MRQFDLVYKRPMFFGRNIRLELHTQRDEPPLRGGFVHGYMDLFSETNPARSGFVDGLTSARFFSSKEGPYAISHHFTGRLYSIRLFGKRYGAYADIYVDPSEAPASIETSKYTRVGVQAAKQPIIL
ncbi:MAG: hypothetical protein ACP5I3_09635 [Thermoproteus sp.]